MSDEDHRWSGQGLAPDNPPPRANNPIYNPEACKAIDEFFSRHNQRQSLVDRFQQDPGVRIFLANLIAGGIGLNLTQARHVVFNDLDWVPANHWQAEDRAYRIGHGVLPLN